MNQNRLTAGLGRLCLLLCFGWTGCGQQVELTPAPKQVGAERVKGTRVSLVRPEGYSQAPSFSGYLNIDNGCSIMVMEIEGPYSEVSSGFNEPKALKAQNITIQERVPFVQGSYPGLLLQVTQESMGTSVSKWIWVFGSGTGSVMVMGTCPDVSVEAEFEKLGEAVRSVSWEPDMVLDVAGDLGFYLGDMGGMKVMPGIPASLAFTPDGAIDKDGAAGKPFFVVTPAVQHTPMGPEKYVTRKIRLTAGHKKVQAGEPVAVQIDGLSGYECMATAIHRKSDEAAFVYQVLLFEGSSYWSLTGTARERDREAYLPIFRRMAASFQRKFDTLKSVDGQLAIDVPANWSLREGLAEEADIQAGQAVADMYVLVYREPKTSFEEGSSFADYTRNVQTQVGEGAVSQSDEIASTMHGMRATRITYQMVDDGASTTYLLGTVEGKEHFYQIVLWCLQEGERFAVADFVRILESLREVE